MTTDIQTSEVTLHFLPAPMRVPLRFGAQTLTEVHCARVKVTVQGASGKRATGWGETPLSVAWVWPSETSYSTRENALKDFCKIISKELAEFDCSGHPFEISHQFIKHKLHELASDFSKGLPEAIPHLAALVCYSAFDLALYDAFGELHEVEAFKTLDKKYMNHDLSHYLEADNSFDFTGLFPQDFLTEQVKKLPVWHLVGGLDPLNQSELNGSEPDDGYPVTLEEWIIRDGLKCLKIKLKGNNESWDYKRLVDIGNIAIKYDLDWLTADFNCTVTEPNYVNQIVDKLRDEHPRLHGMLLYVEQPFPYDLKNNQIDVHSCSARKPLFMDESAHDWTYVRLGRKLGWTGVALKTCKTLTGALLSLCWAKAHGMTLMVQDLTNPMLAQVPHALLASYAGTIKGVESNGMQFYPEVSKPEHKIHPGLYQRKNGILDLTTLSGSGFGYRLSEISRDLPNAVCTFSKNEVPT